MSVQSRSLSGSASGIVEYYGLEREQSIAAYYGDDFLPTFEDAPEAPNPDEAVVFRGENVSGRAAARMGLGVGLSFGLDEHRDVTVADLNAVIDGVHAETGEVLTRHRAAPVYEREAAGKRYRRDADGNKIRKLDRHGKPMTKDSSLSGIDLTVSAPKSLSIAVTVADGVNPAMRDALLRAHHVANGELLDYVQDNARLGKRTVATPTEDRATQAPVQNESRGLAPSTASYLAAKAATRVRLVVKGERVGKPTRMQGSRTERCAVDLAFFTVTQNTARPTQETLDRGAPPDMNLHSHNLIARSGYDPTTGRWTTIDEYALKQAMAAAAHDSVYMGALHRELVAAGVPIEYGNFHDAAHGRMPWRGQGDH